MNLFSKIAWLLVMIGMVLQSCQFHTTPMEPIIVFNASQNVLDRLPSAFLPLNEQETNQLWGKELILGDAFAKQFDLYRAITCYKSALILLPSAETDRRLQLEYNIILCYYLGHKFQDVIQTFEASSLTTVSVQFPALDNLLLMLTDAYRESNQCEKAEALFQIIQKSSEETAIDLSLYFDLKEGDIEKAQNTLCTHPRQEVLQPNLENYYQNALSPSKARTLNAILPGAGYYYVGQKKSALTAFIINALFSVAAYQFFQRGYVAAGVITTSMEFGWYFGGINGAGIEAQQYNTRLYESTATKMMSENRLFPILMFQTAF